MMSLLGIVKAKQIVDHLLWEEAPKKINLVILLFSDA
jgi:hypothetical protein